MKVPKRIGRHEALVKLGHREAVLQRAADESGQILPLLADKDCGLSRADVNILVTGKYARRSWNMLGDAVHLTNKGFAYLAAHREDTRDAELVVEWDALEVKITELSKESESIRHTDWISGQLGRAVRSEIDLLRHQVAELRAERRRRAGGGV